MGWGRSTDASIWFQFIAVSLSQTFIFVWREESGQAEVLGFMSVNTFIFPALFSPSVLFSCQLQFPYRLLPSCFLSRDWLS